MSPSTRNGLLALVVAVGAVFASGCGGEQRLTKGQYERHVRALYGEVRASFQATRGLSGAALAAQLDKASTDLRIAALQLERWEPPQDVEEHNEELAEGMNAYSEQLLALVRALGRGEGQALVSFNERIPRNTAIEQMAEAAEEMKYKGYDLGAIAEE